MKRNKGLTPRTFSKQATQVAKVHDTRARLLLAASKLFAAKGFDGVSVAELALEAQVNISLVSYHFKGKEGLYRACLSQFGMARLAVVSSILKPPKNAAEFQVRLQMFIDEMIRCHLDEPELTTIIHRETEQSLPIIPDIFEESFLKVFETTRDFLAQAQKKKHFRADLDPHLATVSLFGSVFHFVRCDHIGERYFKRTLKNAGHRAQSCRHILEIFLKGVQRC